MPIEKNIADIKKSHSKITKTLKEISNWQIQHEKDDAKRFKEISDAISMLPTEDGLMKAVQETMRITVNGKIDKVSEHLTQQDTNLAALSAKMKPLDGLRTWVWELGKVIIGAGALAGAGWGIIQFLHALHVL